MSAPAVDRLIEEQEQVVAWWDGNVHYRPGPGRGKKVSPNADTFLVSAAEKQLELSKQQVSRWRSQLQDVEKYRGRFSQRDADAYALQMLRKYRRGELGTSA